MEFLMQTWPVQDAKARFSEFLDACIASGPQIVTRRGAETAILVPMAQWKRLSDAAKPTLKELLLSDVDRTDFDLPVRGTVKNRPVLDL